jgi:hypothetical protein
MESGAWSGCCPSGEAEVDVGMLWYDAEPGRAVPAKIERAAAYYKSKYGRSPTVCFLHPATAGGLGAARVGELEVRTSPAVLREHFWLGVGPEPSNTRLSG